MPKFSVVTIVKGRRTQLANLLRSISQSTIIPSDIQIVCMDTAKDIPKLEKLHVSVHEIGNGEDLPLAAARNKGIASAQTDHVVFIDVDCIVSPTLFETILAALRPDNVVAAFPLYLPFVPKNETYKKLRPYAVPHPARERMSVGEPVPHLKFWSLIFAIHKSSFDMIGGFDESFTGYGAEDTDFAMSFHKVGLKHIFVHDFVLHQYHDKYDPPLNHFDAIIKNAGLYLNKWHELPMGAWLKAFEERGLIDTDHDNQITIVRHPTPDEVKTSLSHKPY